MHKQVHSKRHSDGFGLVGTVLIIAVISLVGAIGLLVYKRQTAEPKTIQAVLQAVNEDARKTYANAMFQPLNTLNPAAYAISTTKIDGYDFAVSGVGDGIWLEYIESNKSAAVKQWYGLKRTVPPAQSLGEVKNWVKKQLGQYGFATSDSVLYTRGTDTCGVFNGAGSVGEGYEGQGANLLEIRCFTPEDARTAAAQMSVFVNEYVRANPNVTAKQLTAGPLIMKSKNRDGVINASKSPSYDIAELFVSYGTTKQVALYYAKDNVWQYITRADDEYGFSCQDIQSSPDARKALYDQICLSANGQIRLDTSNRALQ